MLAVNLTIRDRFIGLNIYKRLSDRGKFNAHLFSNSLFVSTVENFSKIKITYIDFEFTRPIL